jgi:hypothetical protein
MLSCPQELCLTEKADVPSADGIIHTEASPVYSLESPEVWSHLDPKLRYRKSGQLYGRRRLGENFEFFTI